ncbi:hypothetical protein [Halomontanus rarus]|uniref:hypothetical protein n=1 Tax=Halomontanus rarus TaxID=3034020 RepID=UPI0023E8D595|nr:hypothetical protein [Halovivax sp. TS33]
MVAEPTGDYPRIYTAGAMRWQNDEDSFWRRSVEESLEDVTFYHPEDSYFDHGGDFVKGAVSEDIQAINAADGVVSYFSETPQVGTTVETLHALHTDTPTLVLFDEDLLGPPVTVDEPTPPPEVQQVQHPKSSKSVGGVEFRGTADDHWFLINYINGDTDQSGQRSIPEWISAWGGTPRGSVVAVTEGDDIRDAVEEWAVDEFGIELKRD